ncbi:MAG: putative collagen-binding domain-containing protein, partial [Bacteroidota bacterium]
TQTPAERIAMAQWFADNDPYQHHRVIHTYPNQIQSVYSGLVGNQSEYTGASVQTSWNSVHSRTLDWVENSEQAGKPWVVANDEQGNANTGVPPDPGYPGYNGSNPDLHGIRKEVLWGNLMAGGAGVEYYFGYNLPDSDLSLQNYRSRDLTWDYVRYALTFFRALPFTTMQSNDDLVDEGWCFARENEVYVVYLKDGGSTTLEIDVAGDYSINWYNPRTGEFATGSIENVTGPGEVNLGNPPADEDEDWAILITNSEVAPPSCGSTVTMFSRNFPFQNTNFYLDNFTGIDLLAINPEQHESAVVSQSFNGPSCLYDLTFHGVGERDGQSKFRLYINGHFLGAVELPLSDQDWEIGPAYNTTFRNIRLSEGDEITVYGEIGTDGQEFSRARWLKIDLDPASASGDCPAIWEEQDGLVVIEMENTNLIGSWDQTAEVGNFTGEGYIQWSGNQHLNATGNGVLRYPVYISTPGTYAFDWRAGIAFGDDNTEHNDSWLKIEADNFFATRQQNNSQVKPRPDCENDPAYDCPQGNSRNGFFKVYINAVDGWTWRAVTSDHEPHDIYATFNNPGVYEIEVNARSSFHRIDRMVLYQTDLVNEGDAQQISNEETLCEGSSSEWSLTIIVGDGNLALPGATVRIAGQDYLTNEEGAVTLSGLAGGLIELLVIAFKVTSTVRSDVN